MTDTGTAATGAGSLVSTGSGALFGPAGVAKPPVAERGRVIL